MLSLVRVFVRVAEKLNVDREARWVKKVGKLRFGFKRHTTINLDGLILAEETAAADGSDIKHLTTSIDKAGLPAGTPVMADKGYCSRENIDALKQRKLKDRIMRKVSRGSNLTAHERQRGNAISRSRYIVERTFGSIRRWLGALPVMSGWPRHMAGTSWRPLLTTSIALQGSLCPNFGMRDF